MLHLAQFRTSLGSATPTTDGDGIADTARHGTKSPCRRACTAVISEPRRLQRVYGSEAPVSYLLLHSHAPTVQSRTVFISHVCACDISPHRLLDRLLCSCPSCHDRYAYPLPLRQDRNRRNQRNHKRHNSTAMGVSVSVCQCQCVHEMLQWDRFAEQRCTVAQLHCLSLRETVRGRRGSVPTWTPALHCHSVLVAMCVSPRAGLEFQRLMLLMTTETQKSK
jgi:hypothetical protein